MMIAGMASIAVPFVTLIFLNGGIVMMLRRQNVQVIYKFFCVFLTPFGVQR